MNKKQLIFLAIILVVFGSLFFYKAGIPSLFEEDEARITEVAREIVVGGRWIDLQHNGEAWFHKPPLYPWLTALTFMVLGMSEFTARLWAGLFGLGAVIGTYFIAKTLFDCQKTSRLSAMILGSSLLFLSLCRAGFVDSALTCFVTLSILFFIVAHKHADRRYFVILSLLAMALGTLAKGPLGVIIPGGSIFIYLIVRRDMNFIISSARDIMIGLAAYFLVAAPWWIAETVLHGRAFLDGLFGNYMFGIFSRTFQKHNGPIYFYVFVILLGMLPWSIHAVHGVIKGLSREERGNASLMLIWAALVFALFSLAQTKIPGYILPIFPPLSILAARSLSRTLFYEDNNSSFVNRLNFGLLFGLALLLFVVSIIAKAEPQFMEAIIIFRGMFLSFTVLSAIAFVIVNFRLLAPLAVMPMLLISVSFLITAVEFILPAAENYKPSKYVVAEVKKIIPEGKTAQYFRYRQWYLSSVAFYSQSKITEIGDKDKLLLILKNTKNAVVFMDPKTFQNMLSMFPRGTYKVAAKWDLVAVSNIKK